MKIMPLTSHGFTISKFLSQDAGARLLRILCWAVFGAALLPGLPTSGAISSSIYYTRNLTQPNVRKVDFNYNGTNFVLQNWNDVASVPGDADGLLILPDGQLLVGCRTYGAQKVNPATGQYTTASGNFNHLMLSPDKSRVWAGYIPLYELPLNSFPTALSHSVSGSDSRICTIAWDSAGNPFYTGGNDDGFGRIDLGTFTTVRMITDSAAHGMSYDPYTRHFIIFGKTNITQISATPSNAAVISKLTINTVNMDQGTVDGLGHLYVASHTGYLVFLDYSRSGLVNSPGTNVLAVLYLDQQVDDVAPVLMVGNNGLADLDLQMSAAPNPTPVGSNLVFTITVTNAGPDTATGAVNTLFFPTNVAFLSAEASQGSCTSSNGSVVCGLGLVPSNAVATIRVTTAPLDPTPIRVMSTVSSEATDPLFANNTASLVVNYFPPTVSLVSPTNGTLLTAPTSVELLASASDSDGYVRRVEFYANTNKIGQATNEPFNFLWTNPLPNNFVLWAVATDNGNNSTTSAPVNLRVQPAISLVSPNNGQAFVYPASISMLANPNDTSLPISQVAFYTGANLLGAVSASPYQLVWSNGAMGDYTLTAVATVNGLKSTSAPVSIRISASNDNFASASLLTGNVYSTNASNIGASKETYEPNHAGNAGGRSVWWSWTSPASGKVTMTTSGSSFNTLLAVYTGSTLQALSLVASDNNSLGNGASRVIFNATAGATYRIAVDGYNGAAGIIILNILGTAPNISITSPSDLAVLVNVAELAIVTAASDPDGNLKQVEFYCNSFYVGVVTSSPFNFLLGSLNPGLYYLSAIARDEMGLAATSAPVRVLIKNSQGGPVASTIYYTRNTTQPNVRKVDFSYDGVSSFVLQPRIDVASVPGDADGLLIMDDGELLVGCRANGAQKVNPATGQYTTATGNANHLMLDPKRPVVWASYALWEIPLDPFTNGIAHNLTGSEAYLNRLNTIAWDSGGTAYYSGGNNDAFGKIDLTNFNTTRLLSGLTGAHGMSYDPFTGNFLLFGSARITQVTAHPTNPIVVATLDITGMSMDQGTVDGQGHLYVASHTGHLVFLDYSNSGLIDSPSNFLTTVVLDTQVDDVAPVIRWGNVNLADLAIGFSAYPNPAPPGSNLYYTIVITNKGPAQATGITNTLLLPENVLFLSCEVGQGSWATNGGKVLCSLGTLLSNEIATIQVVVTPTNTEPVRALSTVKAQETDPFFANNTTSAVVNENTRSVSLVTPTNGSVFSGSSGVLITAETQGGVGAVEKIEFYQNGIWLGEVGNAPHILLWTNQPLGKSILTAVVTEYGGHQSTSAPVYVQIGLSMWVAYNDHVAGGPAGTTAANATTNQMRLSGGPYTLMNVSDGIAIPIVRMNVTTTGSPVTGGAANPPYSGTPLYNTFNGYCYFGTNCIQVRAADLITVTFTNLNPSKKYSLRGGCVRGNNYTDRWTKCDLIGAASFTVAYQQSSTSPYGIIDTTKEPSVGLTGTQVAYNSGENRAGDMMGWTDIVPNAGGGFSFTSTQWQYNSPVPSHGVTSGTFTPSSTSYGYAIDAFRLEEIIVSGEPLAVSISPGSQTVAEGSSITFVASATGGVPPYTYLWYKNNTGCPIAGATSSTLVLNNVHPTDNGSYFVLVMDSAPGGAQAAISGLSVLTVAPANVDLAVQNVSFAPASLSAGQNLSVSFRVRNLGSDASPASNARLQLSADAVLTSSDPGLIPLDVSVPGLNPGVAYDFTGAFTVPAGLLPGTYYVGVTADPDRILSQITRANDVGLSAGKLTVQGTGAPSLLVTPASRDVVSRAGLMGLLIRNIGGGTLSWSASITDAPWLHFTSVNSGVVEPNGTTVVLQFDANPSTSARTGHVLVSAPGASPASQEVTVTQAGSTPPGPTVTHFEFSTIASPQSVNTAFPVTITAMNGVVAQTAFIGRAMLSSEAGGGVSWNYVDFRNGEWTGPLSLNTPCAQTRLVADGSSYGTPAEGQSNPFAVVAANSDVKVTVKVQTQAGAVVIGATVSLQRTGESPVTRVSDSQGQAEFTVAGGAERGSYLLQVEKSGFITHTDTVDIPATPKLFKVQLKPLGKPPVVFVPGGMGSCVGSKRVPVFDDWPPVTEIPLLPGPLLSPLSGKYAAPGDLKLFNPRFPVVGEIVGWETLRDSLSANYAVYEAPWDWRMPVIRPDGSYVAWREYLKPIIKWAKRATGYPKVDVVTHSMGGILVRAYIASDEYEDDIGKFAMVAPPNEGSAKFYHLWFGGDPSADPFYEYASEFNYEIWESPKKWDAASPEERRSFYHKWTKSLEELLPVYAYAISYGGVADAIPYPGHTANPLYQLNTGSFAGYDKQCSIPTKVCAKVFYSTQEATLMTIQVNPRSASSVYPHGRPVGEANGQGDGTVLHGSAWMISFGEPFPSEPFPDGGKHAGLIGKLSTEIAEFLTGQPAQTLARRGPEGPGLAPRDSASNHLAVSVLGRARLWVVDPDLAGAGISPVSDAFTNGWPSSTADVSAYASALERDDASAGLYQGRLKGFPGETLSLDVQFFQTNQVFLTNVSWIVTTNDIAFGIQLNPTSPNPIDLILAALAPTNVTSFSSNGTCHVSWADSSDGVAPAYRIYARREDESLFQLLGSTTNLSYDTSHQWEAGKTGTNWFFAVVALTTNNAESPYTDVVMNAAPVQAGFSGALLSGTPPLTVSFTNLSVGSVTNWAWDFDSDGTIDSTDENPSIVFAEPGSYTVTLTVIGPDGEDTKVAVGYITVFLPSIGNARVHTDRSVEFDVLAQAGRDYLIQSSPDLINWATIANLIATNSTTSFLDTNAPSFTNRFYRIAIP